MDERKKLCVITLGCKANQYDSSALVAYLSEKYILVAPGSEFPADIYLINSCTVTHRADFEARQCARKARKWNPEARIILAGCLASNKPGLKDAEFDEVFDASQRDALLEYLMGKKPAIENDIFYHPSGGLQFRSRALVKVQDGCNYRCSYCIVPYTRGRSRSLAMDLVLNQLNSLSELGFEEASLCGINLGEWGRDIGLELSDLLVKISEARLNLRIRLSSLEPMSINQRLIDTIAESGFICPHLHLPMQSGDNEILKRMKRPYLAQEFLEIAQTLCSKIPALGLGLDVITGFPGEGEEQFKNTLNLLDQIPFSYLHIFTFSPRHNTPAARLKPRVPERVSQERARILAELNRKRKREFIHRQLGKNVEIVVEDKEGDWVLGRSGNYLVVRVKSRAESRKRIRVRLKELRDDELIGEEI